MTKPAIFLDFDGVLNHSKSRAETKCIFHTVKFAGMKLQKDHLDLVEDCVQLVFKLIKEFDADVIVTSMWRFSAKKEWFKELFELYGLELDISRFDMLHTSMSEDYKTGYRSLWIKEYLEENPYDKFVMIDDTLTHYEHNLDKLVHINKHTGFTESDYQKAVDILKKPSI